MNNDLTLFPEFVLYTAPDGKVKLEVFLFKENIWLNMMKMAELFGTSKQNISYHLQNIYKDGELLKDQTVKEILTVQVTKEFFASIQNKFHYAITGQTVAKNYLEEKEIKKLERTVSAFFDYIENLIENGKAFTMSQAEKKALAEYQQFNKTQKIESDFEKEMKRMLKSKEAQYSKKSYRKKAA